MEWSVAGADQDFQKTDPAPPNLQQSTPHFQLPDYMQNWEFGAHAEEDTGFRYFADLIFPLYRPNEGGSALFFEPRVSHVGHGTLMNAGVGYRTLVRQNTWMLGANTFYDRETVQDHYRVGIGGEAISAFAEARINGYIGLSPTRRVQSDGATNNVERAVSGYDVELGAPIPYYSRLKLFGGYEWYNFRKFEDREGWKIRAEYTPHTVPCARPDLQRQHEARSGFRLKHRLPPTLLEQRAGEGRLSLEIGQSDISRQRCEQSAVHVGGAPP